MKLALLLTLILPPLGAREAATTSGWPLSPREEAYVLQPEFKPDGAPRRQGGVSGYVPKLWPVTSCADYCGSGDGDRAWLDAHAKLVNTVRQNPGPLDILLVGDSITQQWGGGYDGKPFNAVWRKYFGGKKTINLGIAGDKTQNVLWRLDHGGVDGLEPKVVILLIGVNNLYFSSEVKKDAMALGIKAVVEKLRAKMPGAHVLVVNELPAAEKPDAPFRRNSVELAAATQALHLETDPKVRVLDIGATLLQPDGTLGKDVSPDFLHLSEKGYEIFAAALRLVVEEILRK